VGQFPFTVGGLSLQHAYLSTEPDQFLFGVTVGGRWGSVVGELKLAGVVDGSAVRDRAAVRSEVLEKFSEQGVQLQPGRLARDSFLD
jgi:hypothetical protein